MGPSVEKDVHFPFAGLDHSAAFWKQPVRQLPDGDYARSAVTGVNVRAYEARGGRRRGGSRSGLTKYVPGRVAGDSWVVQDLRLLVGEGFTPPGGSVQGSASGRVVSLVAVSRGNVFSTVPPGGGSWIPATNNTPESPPLNVTGLVRSTACNQLLFFADGVNACYWVPNTNQVKTWTPTAGQLPVDEDNNRPRLIWTWRGRVGQAGLLLDPQNWFFSAVSDPFNWDYSPLSQSPAQAVAGNNSPLGLIGDVITGVVPWTDDRCIFGGDSSIFMMSGDPMAGGQIDRVSDAIGFAWGEAWCKDPYGSLYFLSNRTGVYRWEWGGRPVRISQAIEQDLQQIDTGASGVRLLWDDRQQGFHLFVTPLSAPGATTHFFWEWRTGGWFKDTFADTNVNPLCCVTFDGNLPTDRAALIGSWDGYVRKVDPAATDDDGQSIVSEVWLGPLLTQTLDDMTLFELQTVLGETSGSVSWAVYVGRTAEAASGSAAVASGSLSAGRNLTKWVNRAGHAVYVKLSSLNPWAMEQVRMRLSARGMVRQRGR